MTARLALFQLPMAAWATSFPHPRNWLLLPLFTCASLLCAPDSFAATIIVEELKDIDFGEVSPTTGSQRKRIRVCVTSDPAGPFQITGLGSGNNGNFELSSGLPEGIAFNVRVLQVRGQPKNLRPGVPVSGLQARERSADGRCLGPVMIVTEIDSADLEAAPGGSYSGLLILTVAPE